MCRLDGWKAPFPLSSSVKEEDWGGMLLLWHLFLPLLLLVILLFGF